MAPRSLRLPLLAIQLASVATLMRSVALDRWITVAACLLLFAASMAAGRGRTWGVALAGLLGITFMSIFALGIAPGWFAILGLLAIRPFARMFRHFVGFDRGAAAAMAAGMAGIGGAAALAWKTWAHALFAAIPALVPSWQPHHGLAVAAIGAAGIFAIARQQRVAKAAEPAATTTTRTRIAIEAPAAEELEYLDEEASVPEERSISGG